MHVRRLLIPILLLLVLAGGILFLFFERTGESRELDRLIAAIPPKPTSRATLSEFEDRHRAGALTTRLIELLSEAGEYGAGGSLGDRIYEMPRRLLLLGDLEARIQVVDPDPAEMEIIRAGLREDLERDTDWPATLRSHRDDWFRWLAQLRKGEAADENAVLGPAKGNFQLPGRRVGDSAILLGWRAIDRFFTRAEGVPLDHEDFKGELDALVEVPADPDYDPVSAYFAKHASRDLKYTCKRIMEIREREEWLLRSLK